MRSLLMFAIAMLCCSPAFAQVGLATPSLGVTSSLGAVPVAPVGPNGLAPSASPSISPVPNDAMGTIAVPSTTSGAGACSTLATSPMGTFGSPATYDGGGMTTATTTPTTAAMPGASASSGISTS